MKTVLKKTAIAATLVSSLGAGMAQADTFQAGLTILTPLALTENTPMHLGRINATTNNDTCVLGAGAVKTGAACVSGGGEEAVGVLDVAGTTGVNFGITLGAPVTQNGLEFAPTLLDDGLGGTATTSVMLAAGHQLELGGTLRVIDATVIDTTVTSIPYDVTVTYE